MKKQLILVIAAGVLALIGVAALVQYANNADDRALEGTETVTVLRATQAIAAKTPIADLADKVEAVKLPKAAVVDGALRDLDGLAGTVTTTALVAGDQITDAKLAKPDEVKGPTALPDGLQQLSLPISGARLVGGLVRAGDRVGVITSYNGVTSNPINQLLVLGVDNGVAGAEDAAGTIVTVAVDTITAQQLVHATEFGTVWLTRQNDTTNTSGGRTITQQDVAP